MEETEQPQRRWSIQRFILTNKCSGHRNTGLKVFCSQTIVNAMKGGSDEKTVDIHLPLYLYLFPLDKTVSHRKYQGRQNKTMLVLFPLISLSLLRSRQEKQGKANFNQGLQKIYSNHQGSQVRKEESGGNFPLSILRHEFLG